MKKIALIALLIATPCAASERTDITEENCYTLFSASDAVIACKQLLAQADVFLLGDYREDTGDDPWYIGFLAKPDMIDPVSGSVIEVTTWGLSPDDAILEAVATLEKIKRGEW